MTAAIRPQTRRVPRLAAFAAAGITALLLSLGLAATGQAANGDILKQESESTDTLLFGDQIEIQGVCPAPEGSLCHVQGSTTVSANGVGLVRGNVAWISPPGSFGEPGARSQEDSCYTFLFPTFIEIGDPSDPIQVSIIEPTCSASTPPFTEADVQNLLEPGEPFAVVCDGRAMEDQFVLAVVMNHMRCDMFVREFVDGP